MIDKVAITIKAGKGGDGAVSFRREKYVAKGGPDGGDGGKGGNIVFVVDEGTNTLLDYKNRRKFKAPDGDNGQGRKFAGKSGADLKLPVPRGTVIKDTNTGRVIHDMSDGLPYIAAKGGRGGWGNTHFATATRQVPRFAKNGFEGEYKELTLELKMLADVGLAGFPNVGKSTLLSKISAANPKVANYHFTTLAPNLGVVRIYEKDFVVADIPGLIEGASEGLGLGHDFLRHIDRCRLILHIFDLSASEREDPLEDIKKINAELKKYSADLASRPQILVGNKIDTGYDKDTLARIKRYAARKGQKLFLMSGLTGQGIDELMRYVAELLDTLPPLTTYESEMTEDIEIDYTDRSVEIKREDGVYHVEGEWIKRVCGGVNFDDRESLMFFQRVLKNSGVIKALEDAGVQDGDTVEIYGIEFDFVL
ncbi:MAG: GTPase ObgE [Clostridia bacterium]|nr:GTPase ObgE [Clostridia bacterium]